MELPRLRGKLFWIRTGTPSASCAWPVHAESERQAREFVTVSSPDPIIDCEECDWLFLASQGITQADEIWQADDSNHHTHHARAVSLSAHLAAVPLYS